MSESKVDRSVGAACCEFDTKEVAKKIEKGIHDAKAVVSAKLEDGKFAADRLVKRGRHMVEDGLDETETTIKHHPFGAVAAAFAAGAAIGFLAPRAFRK